MEFTLDLEPQFIQLKMLKQNRVRWRKSDFVETYLLSLLKSSINILHFFKNFSFSLYVFHYIYITKLHTEIQGREITFIHDGTAIFKKDW